jgi:hypothetical protein
VFHSKPAADLNTIPIHMTHPEMQAFHRPRGAWWPVTVGSSLVGWAWSSLTAGVCSLVSLSWTSCFGQAKHLDLITLTTKLKGKVTGWQRAVPLACLTACAASRHKCMPASWCVDSVLCFVGICIPRHLDWQCLVAARCKTRLLATRHWLLRVPLARHGGMRTSGRPAGKGSAPLLGRQFSCALPLSRLLLPPRRATLCCAGEPADADSGRQEGQEGRSGGRGPRHRHHQHAGGGDQDFQGGGPGSHAAPPALEQRESPKAWLGARALELSMHSRMGAAAAAIGGVPEGVLSSWQGPSRICPCS